VPAEHGTFVIQPVELESKGDDEYVFRFIKLSEPFGYKHKGDQEIVVHLRYRCPIYECTGEDELPTKADYIAALEQLKQNMSAKKEVTVMVADRGYAKIEGTKNEYQANALYIYDGLICIDYDFFDF
jgi:hypothetical protein